MLNAWRSKQNVEKCGKTYGPNPALISISCPQVLHEPWSTPGYSTSAPLSSKATSCPSCYGLPFTNSTIHHILRSSFYLLYSTDTDLSLSLSLYSILTGWGKHSKVVGAAPLKRAIEALLKSIGAPFEVEKCNIGRFTSRGSVVAAWLRESGTLEVLVLRDERIPAHGSSGTRFDLPSNLQPVLL